MTQKDAPKLTVSRLAYLGSMLSKYAHRWSPGNDREPSRRMYDWTDEYNEARGTVVWDEYCKAHGRSLSHDAYDMMA